MNDTNLTRRGFVASTAALAAPANARFSEGLGADLGAFHGSEIGVAPRTQSAGGLGFYIGAKGRNPGLVPQRERLAVLGGTMNNTILERA